MKMFLALLTPLAATVANAGHLLVQPCDLYEGHKPTGGTTSIIEYHWETLTAVERLRHFDRAKEHTKNFSQYNHVCTAAQLEMQAAVRLVVDAVVTCRCPGPVVHLKREQLLDAQVRRRRGAGGRGAPRPCAGDTRLRRRLAYVSRRPNVSSPARGALPRTARLRRETG